MQNSGDIRIRVVHWPLVFLKVVAATALGIEAAQTSDPLWIGIEAFAGACFSASAGANWYLWHKGLARS